MFTIFFPAKDVIRNNRSWLFLAASVFLICSVLFSFAVPAANPADEQVFNGQFDQLMGMFDFIMDAHPVISALLIFMNNFLSMVQMLLLGVIAGISPLLTLGLNGALVGVILSLTADQGIPLLAVIVFGILPHGIFELFAFFLCGALGLKFGYHCVASPLPGMTRLQSFRYIWKEAISILPLTVLLLLLAAFIEIMVTQHLLESFLQQP